MKFSKKENENYLVTKHKDKIADSGYKKYIISIENAYTDILDVMTQEERNELINGIIAEYDKVSSDKKQFKTLGKKFIVVFITIIILLFAAPLLLWAIGQSVKLTRSSYNDMQQNFEVLYEKH